MSEQKMISKGHWFVAFIWTKRLAVAGKGLIDFGSTVIHTKEAWFPIMASAKAIQKMTNAVSVTIVSWQEVTDQQQHEYHGTKPDDIKRG